MVLWFGLLAAAGIAHILAFPSIVWALDPRYAVAYLSHADAWTAFVVLGSLFLALTGGEALYADMGHFGRHAIRVDWFAFVMPALALVYFGQGALVLTNPAAASNPFFFLFPGWSLIPVVILTTAVLPTISTPPEFMPSARRRNHALRLIASVSRPTRIAKMRWDRGGIRSIQ